MPSFVTHLESALDWTHFPARTVQTVHQGRPLWVRYDLQAVREAIDRNELQRRPAGMWRYRELLPFDREGDVVTLGEMMTPLIQCKRLGEHFGMRNLFIKDESRLPTGSFKARGMAMAVTLAKEFGINRVAAPTAGNAGGALAAYAAKAGMDCSVFMPADTPIVNQFEAAFHGAKVFLVNGSISDCGRIVREGIDRMRWFDFSTLREPYRLEGKKTMGMELAEQFGWRLPDVILFPTGGGTGLIGMWKAFDELARLGWLESDERPRMFACQSCGCAPIVEAFEAGERFARPAENPRTIASGLCVPAPIGDFMILDVVRESGGRAVAAAEDRLLYWMRVAASLEGIPLCPEAATCVDVLKHELEDGSIRRDQSVVIFNTGAAQKYVEAIHADLPKLDCTKPIAWERLAEHPGTDSIS